MSADQEKYPSHNQSEQDDLQNTTSLSLALSKKHDSTVWPYFNEDTGSPVCKLCNTPFSAVASTSTLRRHLKIHDIIAPKRKHKHLVINPYLEIEQQKRDNLVVRWIICDLQSFNVVEGEEWRAMISKFDPRYQFPSRNMIRDYVTELFQKKKSEVKLALHKISNKVAFTSDLWTASNGMSFLSLTIHYVDSFWKLKHFLLDIIPIKERHTGVNIANTIMDVLDEYSISEKTLALTTDNASSMILCATIVAEELQNFNNFEFSHYRCAAHILNLAVGSGLDFINESIVKVRSLMSYIKMSQPTINNLKKLCEIKNIEYLAPELDVKHRWNSTYYMLNKWKRMESPLTMLVVDDLIIRQKCPDENDRANINDYLSRYKDDANFSQNQVATAIYQKLEKYWPILDENSQISTLLDPRTKLTAFRDLNEKTKAINLVSNLQGYSIVSNSTPTPNDLSSTQNYFRQLRISDSSQENQSDSFLLKYTISLTSKN
ncbi:16676_t:CDS:2 [Cetraspora pellucida]|uniref:16676_t:CDS:1 n=1 Tax=Cetraspora pellucida TaxID=1433469 RepID=A0ACA9K862_9GLOM|nr:16676_t:CDS:2 [Cetraspora pellucida]